MEPKYPYRVFVSYVREDSDLARLLVQKLRATGLNVAWDRDISTITPASPFSDTIKGLIAHAHIFMPLLTKRSKNSPWVHQETGFAIANEIPVLLIEANSEEQYHDRSLLDEARGMTASLQTIQVQEKLEDFDYKFDEVNIDRLVMPPPPRPVSMFEVTEWAEKRTELMALYANREIQIGHHGRIRQKAAFSSFYIPDENVTVPVWKLLEGDSPRSDYYRYLLRQERNALEEHARVAGCRLIISPYTQSHYSGPSIGKPRIKSLLNFLRDMPDDKLEVVLSPLARQNNHTIVGDWFAAESHIPSPGGYRHTVFHFHASTVLRHIKRFDEEFVRVRDIVFQKNNCTACILSDSGLST